MKNHRISIRIGSPFWKLFACIGAPLHLRVTTYFDRESSTYCAYSADLDGLAVCADSFPDLIEATRLAADDLTNTKQNSPTSCGGMNALLDLAFNMIVS